MCLSYLQTKRANDTSNLFAPVVVHAEKYPEIRQLMRPDPWFKWQVTAMVFTQFLMFFLLRNASWPTLLLAAYFFGGVINHALMLALHEIAHNQAFGHGVFLPNRLFGIFANLPVGLPASISFRKYHLEHHRYQVGGVPFFRARPTKNPKSARHWRPAPPKALLRSTFRNWPNPHNDALKRINSAFVDGNKGNVVKSTTEVLVSGCDHSALFITRAVDSQLVTPRRSKS